MKILLVGGDWDRASGRPSYLIKSLILPGVEILNGGNINELRNMDFNYDAVIWMPNIDNSEEKILPVIKKRNPALLLVQSKCGRQYSTFELIKRLLSSHSCMGLIVSDDKQFSVIDPLGNQWIEGVGVQAAMDVIMKQLLDLGSMTRQRTNNIVGTIDFDVTDEFLGTVHSTGKKFATRIDAINKDRFLGNASTRCSYGFPSARLTNHIAVSKRNVNKEIISKDQFVAATLVEGNVYYVGDCKPSVDTPIQLALYERYPNVHYMIHGHCYVEGAPYTKKHVPCGYLEEVDQVLEAIPNTTTANFVVNLLGHGCLICADNMEFIEKQKFQSKPLLEKI